MHALKSLLHPQVKDVVTGKMVPLSTLETEQEKAAKKIRNMNRTDAQTGALFAQASCTALGRSLKCPASFAALWGCTQSPSLSIPQARRTLSASAPSRPRRFPCAHPQHPGSRLPPSAADSSQWGPYL